MRVFTKRFLAVAAAGAVLTLSLAACGRADNSGGGAQGEAEQLGPIDTSECPASSTEAISGDTIKLGTSAALSGAQSSTAESTRGFQAYIDYVNETGGVKTVDGPKTVELIVLDDQGEPSRAAQNADRLIHQEGVVALSGVFGTATNLAAAPMLAVECVPSMWANAGGASLPDEYPFATQTSTYTAQGKAVGTYISENVVDAKVAVLYQNDDIGTDALEGLVDSGVDIIAEESYEVTDADLNAQITTLSYSGADTVFLQTISNKCTQALNAIGQSDWRPQIFTTYLCGTAAASAAPADVTENLYGAEYRVSSTGADNAPDEMVEYLGKADLEVTSYTAGGWECGELTIAAIENAKVLSSVGLAQSARSLPADLEIDIFISGIQFSVGASGPASYDSAIMEFLPAEGHYDLSTAVIMSGE